MAEGATNTGQQLGSCPFDERRLITRAMNDRTLAFLQGIDESVRAPPRRGLGMLQAQRCRVRRAGVPRGAARDEGADSVVLDPQLSALESTPHILAMESLIALQDGPFLRVDETTRRRTPTGTRTSHPARLRRRRGRPRGPLWTTRERSPVEVLHRRCRRWRMPRRNC